MHAEDRFWRKVDRRGPDECWEWKAHKIPKGYGYFHFQQKKHRAHRVAFYLTYGYWPMVGRHTCDNRGCCNPAHVIDGTVQDNNRDMITRGRYVVTCGESHGNAKLTDSDVISIRLRAANGEGHRSIAKDFGVCQTNVSRIVRKAAWAHVQ